MRIVLLLLAISQNYLLMQPIQQSIKSQDFTNLEKVCQERVAANLEAPLALQGYFYRHQFIEEFARRHASLVAEKIEWSSIQVEDNLAVQSLNLVLLDRFSGKRSLYKLIFYMAKKEEWQIYYLRGLAI